MLGVSGCTQEGRGKQLEAESTKCGEGGLPGIPQAEGHDHVAHGHVAGKAALSLQLLRGTSPHVSLCLAFWSS